MPRLPESLLIFILMFQASKTARPTNDDLIMCDRCGGRHHNRKCQFRGTCFDCGRRVLVRSVEAVFQIE